MATAPGNGGNGPPSQPSQDNPDQPFDLLGLPFELREMVYKHVLSPYETIICNQVCPNILRASRQIYHEASPILQNYWAPRILFKNIAAARTMDELRRLCFQQIGHPSEHLHPNTPPNIVMSTDELRAWAIGGSSRQIPRIQRQLIAGMPSRIADAIWDTYGVDVEMPEGEVDVVKGLEELVLHLDITESVPWISIGVLEDFIWQLRHRKITVVIHAPNHPLLGPACAEEWVTRINRMIRADSYPHCSVTARRCR